MLIKKLIGICKKSGIIMLCETDGKGQWLGTGAAMYPLFDLPEFDRHTICRTYDISEKQAEKIIFRHEPELPESFCFSDIDESESLCDPIEMEITVKGQSVQPYMTSQGIAFIDRKYLQPLEDGGRLRFSKNTCKWGRDASYAYKKVDWNLQKERYHHAV